MGVIYGSNIVNLSITNTNHPLIVILHRTELTSLRFLISIDQLTRNSISHFSYLSSHSWASTNIQPKLAKSVHPLSSFTYLFTAKHGMITVSAHECMRTLFQSFCVCTLAQWVRAGTGAAGSAGISAALRPRATCAAAPSGSSATIKRLLFWDSTKIIFNTTRQTQILKLNVCMLLIRESCLDTTRSSTHYVTLLPPNASVAQWVRVLKATAAFGTPGSIPKSG